MRCAHDDPDRALAARRKEKAARAEAAFKERLEAMGATLLDTEWLGSHKPHRTICVAGHLCTPAPNTVRQGGGICKVCVSRDPATAWKRFRAAVEGLDGTVIESAWLGSGKPHRIRCAAGHETAPKPHTVRKTGGICRICSGRDSEAAWVNFKSRIAELGGVVVEESWLGCETPHRAICPSGHPCSPLPKGVQQGGGMCRVCVGNDPAASEAKFRARVAELGGDVLEQTWLGSDARHRVRCAKGHEVMPKPSSLLEGRGLCRFCKGLAWDVFYVVVNDADGRVKFGITAHGGKRRLRTHRRAGYGRIVRLLDGLPGDLAIEVERSVRATLRLAKEFPVHGREYFGIHVLGTVLDIVDNYPIPAA
jgi:hypothetical protein